MNGLPSHHPPIPTTSCKEHLPSQAASRPLPGGGGWDGAPVRNWKPDSPLRAPAARHRDCSNTADGLTSG